MAHHVSSKAQADLDHILYYLYKESGSAKVADRQIAPSPNGFTFLATIPLPGAIPHECAPSVEALQVLSTHQFIGRRPYARRA